MSGGLRVALIAVAAVLLSPAFAQAGDLSAVVGETSCYRTVCSASLSASYRAAPGELVDAVFREGAEGRLQVVDQAGVRAGAGCRSLSTTEAECTFTDPSINSPFIALTGVGSVRDDRLIASRSFFTPRLEGGIGDDVLTGRGTLIGGPGDDVLDGLDESITELDGGPGADVLSRGTVSYLTRTAAVHFDASRPGSTAGERGEGDIVGAQVRGLDGGAGNDVLIAASSGTDLSGGRGQDVLRGGADNELLDGGPGSDRLDGGAGADELTGGGSSKDRDVLNGGPGNDYFRLSPSSEIVSGGAGRDDVRNPRRGDRVALRDGQADLLSCNKPRAGHAPVLRLDAIDRITGTCQRPMGP